MDRFKLGALVALMIALMAGGCSTDEQKKRAHYEKGEAYYAKGEYKAAKIELKNAVQIDPKYAAAQLKLAETSLKLGEAQEAFRAYAAVAELELTVPPDSAADRISTLGARP